jgi:DNA-binding transcriptional ArsR family regulator
VAARTSRSSAAGDRLLRAISHPIRIEILRILSERVASPKELARESGESLSDISYHVKYLREEGCVEMLDTEPRRGAIEHFYRIRPPRSRADVSAEAIRGFLGEAVRALNAGSFDAREDRHLSWMTMALDEEGWRELVERQARWLEELERIEAEAAERLAAADAAGRAVVAGMLGFEAPPALSRGSGASGAGA